MSLSISTALRNVILDSGFNAVFNSGVLEIRSGTRPADADTAPAGTLLASITLPADAFAAASGGAVAKAGTWEDSSADAAGTATWFRFKQSGDLGTTNSTDERMDGRIETPAVTGWVTSTAYVATDKRTHNSVHYICTENHTSGADDEPGIGPSWRDMWDQIDLTLDNTTIASAQVVTISTFTVTQPAVQ